jgi:hypothetical protein
MIPESITRHEKVIEITFETVRDNGGRYVTMQASCPLATQGRIRVTPLVSTGEPPGPCRVVAGGTGDKPRWVYPTSMLPAEVR